MAKKKEVKKEWPPKKWLVGWESDEPALVKELAGLSGMNPELAEKIVNDGNWPADAHELASRYGMAQMDAEAVLKVLNENRG